MYLITFEGEVKLYRNLERALECQSILGPRAAITFVPVADE